MRDWGKDILLTRRGLIACAAGLVIAKTARASLTPTPEQTAGPFYPSIKPADSDADLTRVNAAAGRAAGETIEITGRVLSVRGHALGGAVVEIWQTDANGRYFDPSDMSGTARDQNFQGYGAVRTGADGAYMFRTIRPAAYGSILFRRTPHIHFRVVADTLGELVTQLYFPDEPMNRQDALYLSLPGEMARAAATARAVSGGDVTRFTYDLVLA